MEVLALISGVGAIGFWIVYIFTSAMKVNVVVLIALTGENYL